MSIEKFVNGEITRDTVTVSRPSYNIPLIVSEECNFTDRVRYYTTLSGLASDLDMGTASYTYAMASSMLRHGKRVPRFGIGNRASSKYLVFDGTWTAAGTVSVNVNGVAVTSGSYTTDMATTLAQFAVNIGAALSGSTVTLVTLTGPKYAIKITPASDTAFTLSAPVVAGVTGTMTAAKGLCVTADFGSSSTYTAGSLGYYCNGTTGSVSYTTNKAGTLSALDTALLEIPGVFASELSGSTLSVYFKYGSATTVVLDFYDEDVVGTLVPAVTLSSPTTLNSTLLDAFAQYSPDWYGISIAYGTTKDSAAITVQRAVMDWVETNGRVFWARSSDNTIIDSNAVSDVTSLPYYGSSLVYAKTRCLFNKKADTYFHDSSEMGKILSLDPGSYTAQFKTLTGCGTDILTDTEILNAESKNCAVYYTTGGTPVVDGAKVLGGEWVDTIVGVDWQKGLIKAAKFAVLKKAAKVPYDDIGIGQLTGAVSEQLEAGITTGLYTKHMRDDDGVVTGGYYVTAVPASEVSDYDKNTRNYSGISFTAFLAGAIHSSTFTGFVRV